MPEDGASRLLPPGLRPAITEMEPQKISAVSRLGIGQPDVIPLWYGESDLVTPAFICDAATDALAAGRTFYVQTRGVPELRTAIADYLGDLYGTIIGVDRVTVTGSAMTAIMIALQCLVSAGDNVVMISPMWPNAFHAVGVLGGETRFVPLNFSSDGWTLHLDRLFAACDRKTRAIFIASPANPTGWVMTPDDQRAVLAFCRERGLWVVADEVYHRVVFDQTPAAPSFLEIAAPDDPLLVVNSFSKAWAMTGWRLGWIVAPPAMGDLLGQLSAFNNTGATSFVQHAGIVALRDGEPFVRQMIAYCDAGRRLVEARLAGLPRITIAPVAAGLFAYVRVEGMGDSLTFAQRLLRERRLGLAPGAAFGPGSDDFLRICFALHPQRLAVALDRLADALS